MSLQGHTAVITAAAQGIGRATVEAFARMGARVIATDVNEAKLEELKSLSGVEIRKLDVLDEAAVGRLFAAVGPVDTLFNCAGIVYNGTILDCTPDELDFAYNLNVKAMVRTIRAVLPGMIERGRGDVIQVSSVAGFFSGRGSTYTASKNWVTSFTEGIAVSLPKGVRMMALCPGFTATEFHERAGIGKPGPKIAWLGVEQVVNEALADLRRGKVISVPSLQYKVVVAIGGLLPRAVLRRISGGRGRT